MSLPHRSPLRRPRTAALAVAVLSPLLLSLLVPAEAAADDQPGSGETVVGELVQAWPEHEDRREAAARAEEGPLTWIETAAGESVRVPTAQLAQDLGAGGEEDLPVGATVEVVVGDEVPDAPAAEEGIEPALEVLSAAVVAAAPTEPATQGAALTAEVTVVMMIPRGGAPEPGRSLADVVATVNGPVNDFWNGESNGAVRVVAAATNYDWFQGTVDCSNAGALWNEAASHAPTFRSGPGKHLLVYLPANTPGCSYGLAQVGWSVGTGGRLYVTDDVTSVIAHELGHNFGLGHASALSCNTGIEEEATNACAVEEYYDQYDVMGFSGAQVGSLNAPHAARLGFLPADQQALVQVRDQATRTYALLPTGGRSGLRALRLVDEDGTEYWLEYRTASGRDAWLPGSRLQTGVQLRRGQDGSDTSLLLDATPVTGRWGDPEKSVLPVGSPVRVAGGRFVVTVASADATAASVVVSTDNVGPARLPTGSFDGASLSGPTLTAGGWAIDPNTPTRPVDVRITVDGRAASVAADGDRPDVGWAFPAAGSRHGFTYSTVVTEGRHDVCAYALDSSGWGSTPMGCRAVTYVPQLPLGSLDRVALSGRTLLVDGWMIDGDTPTVSGQIHLYVNGRWGGMLTADRERPDVGRAFPAAGSAHGFTLATDVSAGPQQVCAYAMDTAGRGNTPFGCRTVTYVPRLPLGSLDGAAVSGGTLTVGGWTLDQDTPALSGRVQINVDAGASTLVADVNRSDVGRAFPGAGDAHGFSFATPIAPGSHRVCVYALDTWNQGSRDLGCRTVGR